MRLRKGWKEAGDYMYEPVYQYDRGDYRAKIVMHDESTEIWIWRWNRKNKKSAVRLDESPGDKEVSVREACKLAEEIIREKLGE